MRYIRFAASTVIDVSGQVFTFYSVTLKKYMYINIKILTTPNTHTANLPLLLPVSEKLTCDHSNELAFVVVYFHGTANQPTKCSESLTINQKEQQIFDIFLFSPVLYIFDSLLKIQVVKLYC